MRAILFAFALNSVNHRLPSGPAVMPLGWLPAGDPKLVFVPLVVMRDLRTSLSAVRAGGTASRAVSGAFRAAETDSM